MSIREVFPGDRGGEATADVASLLAGITLPSIEPFGSDNAELVGLPPLLLYPLPEPDVESGVEPDSGSIPEPEPRSVLSVARGVRDAGLAALAEVKRLEDVVAGRKARLVARVAGAAAVEASVVALDAFQRGVASAGLVTEVAFALGIPEPSAASLLEHSVVLLGERPVVLAGVEAGELSWRHAVTINDEIATLGSMGGATAQDEAVLEERLLFLAPGTTAFSFQGKARRAREKMFPESIPVRVKEAFAKRKLVCSVGADGMAWLGLHMPAVSASGIYTRCTRLARAIKADGVRAQAVADAAGTGQDCREHRTLAQLRADVAAILLLGQNLPETATQLLNDAETTLHSNSQTNPEPRNGHTKTNTGTSTGTSTSTGAGAGNPASQSTGCGAGVDCGGVGGLGGQGSAFGAMVRHDGQDTRPYVPPWSAKNPATTDTGITPDTTSTSDATAGTGAATRSDATRSMGGSVLDQDDVPVWATRPNPTNNATPSGATPRGAPDCSAPGGPMPGGTVDGVATGAVTPSRAGSEGIPLPTTSPATDLSTSPAAAGIVSADAADALYFADPADPADPADSEGRNPANLLDPVEVVGDGSGLVGDVVDGLVEDPQADYERQLVELAAHGVLVDPPLPDALVLVKVPFLGLLGITDEPAELVGAQGGPVPEDVARKLLKNSSSFLRVLTDPITGEALPLEPQRYVLRAAERAVLQGLAGCCYVPNCPHPVLDTELDHLRAFEFGGPSVMANLRPACQRHHLMKHFKDDKDRHGRRRCIDEPERAGITLRGWSPQTTPDGRIGWITPSGTYLPPLNTEPARPEYPTWLKNLITHTTKTTKKPAS